MFARDLRDCSGPWSGFWVQESIRGHMKLRLRFGEAVIEGEGADPSGEFTVSGIFRDVDGRVIFGKTYAHHRVDYAGVWDGYLIHGRWTLADDEYSESGDFEIWPDKDEIGLGALSASMVGLGPEVVRGTLPGA